MSVQAFQSAIHLFAVTLPLSSVTRQWCDLLYAVALPLSPLLTRWLRDLSYPVALPLDLLLYRLGSHAISCML